jgi:hypothetical protein
MVGVMAPQKGSDKRMATTDNVICYKCLSGIGHDKPGEPPYELVLVRFSHNVANRSWVELTRMVSITVGLQADWRTDGFLDHRH